MAARVNTKLIAIVAVCIVVAVGVIGAFALLQYRGDAARNIRQGDDFMAAGEYGNALSAYGRAISKEPSNLGYVDKAIAATERIVPKTRDELRQRFELYESLLEKRVGIASMRPELHLPLLDLKHAIAQLDSNNPAAWASLQNVAERMAQSVDPSDPGHATAVMYRAIGALGRRGSLDEAQYQQTLTDLRTVIGLDSGNDLAQASYVRELLFDARRRQSSGRPDAATIAATDAAQNALREAVRRVPRGPLVAAVELQSLLLRRLDGDASVTDAAINAVSDRVIANLEGATQAWVLDRALFPVALAGNRESAAKAAELVSAFLAKHPGELAAQQVLLAMLATAGELSSVKSAAIAILDMEPQPVGLQAMVQEDLRISAATALFDVDFAAYRDAAPEDRPAARATTEASLARLRKEIENPALDPRMLQSEARLAGVNGRWAEALSKYEEAIRQVGEEQTRIEVFYEAAIAAAETDQLGIARRRIDQAVAAAPRFVGALILKAELERRDGNLEAARATLAQAAAADPNDPRIAPLREALAVTSDDEIVRQLAVAQARFDRGDVLGAQAQMEAALQKRPGEARYLRSLAFIELILGNSARAAELAKEGLAIAPNDEFFRRAEALATTTDPVERIVRTIEIETPPGPERDVRTFRAIARTLIEQRLIAQRLRSADATEQAANAEAAVSRLTTEVERLRARFDAASPPDPLVAITDLDLALSIRDFDTAEAVVARESSRQPRVLSDAELASMKARLLLTQVDGDVAAHSGTRRERLVEASRILQDATLVSPETTDLHVLLGRIQYRLGNTSAAVDSYETAYAQRPNDMVLVEGFVDALQAGGEHSRALQVLRDASRRREVTPGVRTRWLLAEALGGDRLRALLERRAMYNAAPDDLGNVVQYAALLMTLPPSRELILDTAGRARYPDERWRAMPVLQQRQILEAQRQEWQSEAERILSEMATRAPLSFEIASLRAELARLRGDAGRGEQILRAMVDEAGDEASVEMLMALGGYLVGIGRPDDAKSIFDDAVRRQTSFREADRALARLALQRGDAAGAIAHLRSVAESSADPRDRLAVVEALSRAGDIAAADAMLLEIEAESAMDADVALMRAAIASQQLDAAVRTGTGVPEATRRVREALTRAQELRPSDPAPLVGQAQLLMSTWQLRPDRQLTDPALDEAAALLDRALDFRADYWPGSRLRAQLFNIRGDSTRARLEVERFLTIAPTNDDARLALVELWTQARAFDRAVAVAREASDVRPADPKWHRIIGDRLDRMGDVAGAVAAHRRALELEPGASPDRLVMLMLRATPTHPPEHAAVVQLLGQRTAAIERSPYLRGGFGAALANIGRRAEGLEQLRASWRQYQELLGDRPDLINGWFDHLWLVYPLDQIPEAEALVTELANGEPGPFALRELARRYAAQGAAGFPRAIELLQRAASAAQSTSPQHQALIHFDLGTVQYQFGACDAAVRSMETAVGLAPNNPAILNNLAYAYIECTKDAARALPHAQRAVSIAPGEASFLDTYGLALERVGRLPEAEQQYRAALAVTRLGMTHVHLARVLGAQNRATEARAELRKAVEVDPRIREDAEFQAVEAQVTR